jgi:hypothetical protein
MLATDRGIHNFCFWVVKMLVATTPNVFPFSYFAPIFNVDKKVWGDKQSRKKTSKGVAAVSSTPIFVFARR